MRLAALVLVLSVAVPGVGIAEDSCIVRGRVLGHDGKPIPKVVMRPLVAGARSTIPDHEGRFSVMLPCGAARVFAVEGVHHEGLLLPVLTVSGEPLEVEIRLRAQRWADRIDSVRVIREADGYAIERALPMSRRRDGTFAATVPCESESLRYQLLGVARDGVPTAGTMADTFFMRGDRSIASVRAGRQPVEVLFDPKRLPRSRTPLRIRFADPGSATARIHALFQEDAEHDLRLSAAFLAHVAAGGDRDSFHWDWSARTTALKRRVGEERDPLRRQYMLLNYFRHAGQEADSLLARSALEELPPDSPLWGLAAGGPSTALWNLWRATGDPDQIGDYAERGSEIHPDRELRAGFLMAAITTADQRGDKDRLGRHVTRMLDEFAGTMFEQMVRAQHGPDRAVRLGQPAPDFTFTGFEDSTQAIRIADFRGRHLLLDFWAVWCGPCRFEMPGLHRAWETFEARGLALLSVSFDRTREDVAAYRRDKWAMPWLHAFASEGFGGKEAAAFGIWGIPMAILIGPDGTVLAAGNELRGEKLHATLARVLGEPGTPAVKKE